MTAEEHRTAAHDAHKRSAESWERSDTDGFLTQWASDVTAREHELADKFADAANKNTVNGELNWIFTEIVSGGEDEMYTADGVEDLVNACERNEFGENAELVEAAGIARTMLND